MSQPESEPVEPQRPPSMRVGDAERNAAIEALGVHMSAGRLSMDEYGERTAKVTVARTTDDLRALFADLPAPHPKLPLVTPPQTIQAPLARTAPTDSRIVPATDERTPGQRWAAAAVPIAAIIAVLLFFVLKTWLVFLLPALVAVIAGTATGSNRPRPPRPGD